MPSRNVVTIILNAEDNASAKIRDAMRGIEGATARGTFAGGMMGRAFDAAFDLASKAASGFIDQLGRAEESYQSAIKSAQVFKNQFGGSLEAGQDAIYKMQSELAKQAAILPGTAEDYAAIANAIFDNVAATSANAEEATKRISELSIKIGSRFTKEAGVTDSQRVRLSERLLTDNLSIKNMERLMPVMQDAALRNALRKAEIKFGTSFADAVGQKRQEMVMAALNHVQSDDVVKKSSETFGSSIAQINDRIFGLYNGIFGARRDLDLTQKGEQSVYTKLGEMMGSFIKLGDTIGKITDRLGLGADPMAALGRGIDGLNNWFKSIDKVLKPFADSQVLIPTANDFNKIIGDFAGNAANAVNKWLDGAIAYLQKADSGAAGTAVGEFVGGLASAFVRFLASIDYGKMLIAVAAAHGRIIDGFNHALLNAANRLATELSRIAVESVQRAFNTIVDWLSNINKIIGQALDQISGGMLRRIGNALGVGTGTNAPPVQGAFGEVKVEGPKMPSLFGNTAPTIAPTPQISAPQITVPQSGGMFAPTINLQSNATDPKQVASIAISEINRLYQQRQLGFT